MSEDTGVKLISVPSTYEAVAVAVLALLPGASYTFAFERQAGAFGVALADRLIRFLTASAILHALASGGTYEIYRRVILTHRLRDGHVRPIVVELVALGYVAVPLLLGKLFGWGYNNDKRWSAWLLGKSLEPRTWDWLWHQHAWIVRLRLKSGQWLAGVAADLQGEVDAGGEAYFSGYPESGELFLPRQLQIDNDTGELLQAGDEKPRYVDSKEGLFIRWDEVEYICLMEW